MAFEGFFDAITQHVTSYQSLAIIIALLIYATLTTLAHYKRAKTTTTTTFERVLATFKPVALCGDAIARSDYNNCNNASEEAELGLNLIKLDFLSLSRNAEIRKAAAACIKEYGVGTCGPRSFYGSTVKHREVERKLAAFCGTQMALVYSYGAMTTCSVIATYVTRKDIAFVDELVSKQVLLGLKAKRAQVHCFKHNQADDLCEVLTQMVGGDAFVRYTSRFLVLEGVYASTGSVCALRELMRVARCFQLRVIIDESFSLGVLGATGRGITEHARVHVREVDLLCGSLAHVFGAEGGYCAGSAFIECQTILSPSFVYSASLPTFLAQTIITSLNHIGHKPTQLRTLSHRVATHLLKLNHFYNVLSHIDSPHKIIRVRHIPEHQLQHVHAKIVQFCKVNFGVFLSCTVFGLCINLNHALCFDQPNQAKLFNALDATTEIITKFYEEYNLTHDNLDL